MRHMGCIRIKISVIFQKRVTLDFLSKRQKVNEGEVPQYYVEESHEAIIPPEEWEIVQLEMARRKALGRKYSGNSILRLQVVWLAGVFSICYNAPRTPFCTTKTRNAPRFSKNAPRFRAMHQALSKNAPRQAE